MEEMENGKRYSAESKGYNDSGIDGHHSRSRLRY